MSLFVSGFLPTDSATFDPIIPSPIPIPKKANPNIVPIAVIVDDNIDSIGILLILYCIMIYESLKKYNF
jgi:hypothetical protein